MYSIKRSNLFLAVVMIASMSIITACHSTGREEVEFCEFPRTVMLEGHAVSIPDEELRVFGMADVVDDGYVYYLYSSPYALSASDKNFSAFHDFASKGQAPGEVCGVSALFARNPSNGSFTVYDPYMMKMYETSFENDLILNELITFPDDYRKYSPTQVVKLDNGSYVGARGDFNYGLVCYNPDSCTVAEWPLGGEFNREDPVYDEVSMRAIGYNEHRGVIGEIYGTVPVVFLHDGTGRITGRYSYTGYRKHTDPDNNVADCFIDIELGDNYIWLLYGDPDEVDKSKVFTLDYDGNPIAEFVIMPTYTIAVDEQERRLLSINPNIEEGNLTVYDLPDFLWK